MAKYLALQDGRVIEVVLPEGGPAGPEGPPGADGEDGATGAPGRGILTIERTSGTGAPGTVDTYTITYTDLTTSTFTVRNGADGTGGGSGSSLADSWQGQWMSDAPYVAGDVVHHEGSSWFALAPSTGVEPGIAGSDATWDPLALAGEFIDNYLGGWSSATQYLVGDMVTYQGTTFLARTEPLPIGVPPAFGGGDGWRVVARGAKLDTTFSGQWIDNIPYDAGSLVTHNGATWLATVEADPSIEPVEGEIQTVTQDFNVGSGTYTPPTGWRLRSLTSQTVSASYVSQGVRLAGNYPMLLIDPDVSAHGSWTLETKVTVAEGLYNCRLVLFSNGNNGSAVYWELGGFSLNRVVGASTQTVGSPPTRDIRSGDIMRAEYDAQTGQVDLKLIQPASPTTGPQLVIAEGVYNVPAGVAENNRSRGIMRYENSTTVTNVFDYVTTTIVTPTSPPWTLFSSKGDKGEKGDFLSDFRGAWDADVTYTAGDIVQRGGFLYVAVEPSLGASPYETTIYEDNFDSYPENYSGSALATDSGWSFFDIDSSNGSIAGHFARIEGGVHYVRPPLDSNTVAYNWLTPKLVPNRYWKFRYRPKPGFDSQYLRIQLAGSTRYGVFLVPAGGYFFYDVSVSSGDQATYSGYPAYVLQGGDLVEVDQINWVISVTITSEAGEVVWGPHSVTVVNDFRDTYSTNNRVGFHYNTTLPDGDHGMWGFDDFYYEFLDEDIKWSPILSLSGGRGLPGAVGPRGPQGTQGIQGIQGIQGVTGTVGNRYKGPWSAGAAYLAQDLVTHAGSLWLAVDGSTGQAPFDGSAYWTVMASKGDPGATGAPGAPGADGTGVQTRATATYVTNSLADSSTETGLMTFGQSKGWRLLRIEASHAARIRIYSSVAQRVADAARPLGTDPEGDHGLLFEFVTTAELLEAVLSPMVDGAIFDNSLNLGEFPISVTNRSGSSTPVTTTLTYVRTE